MKTVICLFAAAMLTGCATLPTPTWNAVTPESEAEYQPYLKIGSCALSGQAFLVQAGGQTVRAAGRTITLDPATSIGTEWWNKAGRIYYWRYAKPSSDLFLKARHSTIADAEGRFKFSDLPAGNYYIRTEVTWEITRIDAFSGSPYNVTQGGVLGHLIEVTEKPNDVILSDLAN